MTNDDLRYLSGLMTDEEKAEYERKKEEEARIAEEKVKNANMQKKARAMSEMTRKYCPIINDYCMGDICMKFNDSGNSFGCDDMKKRFDYKF